MRGGWGAIRDCSDAARGSEHWIPALLTAVLASPLWAPPAHAEPVATVMDKTQGMTITGTSTRRRNTGRVAIDA